ncbi:MAG TPA: hypothetical protein VH372_02125 [Actinospica sp.]|jgi:hypothetical protein|nr:hypothetical protein [Actinospica sp.]
MPPPGRRRARTAFAAAAFAFFGALGAAAAASPAAAAARGGPFAVYDNTFYSNVDLGRVGAVRSNVIYEAPVAQLAGQNPAHFRGARPASAELALPPQSAYADLVRRTSRGPGPVVLDFETLYLKGSPTVAHRRFRKLQTLLSWAHQAVPGRVVGYYGVAGNTESRYLPLERRLAVNEDALFPSLYTFSDNLAAWHANFRRIVAEARSVAPGKRVYAYLWPQYHGGSARAGAYLTPAHWRYELDTATKLCAGVVIWGPAARDSDQRWVGATAGFLSTRR